MRWRRCVSGKHGGRVDYFDVILAGAADRDEERDAVTAEADKAPVGDVVRARVAQTGGGDALVMDLLRESALVSMRRLDQQVTTAEGNITAEAGHLKKGDPGKVRPINNVDVATERARRAESKGTK